MRQKKNKNKKPQTAQEWMDYFKEIHFSALGLQPLKSKKIK